MLINRGRNGTSVWYERDEMRNEKETVFERLQRHAGQTHGITLSREETKELADRMIVLEAKDDGSDVWKAIRSHMEKIYRLEREVDELTKRVRNLERE